MIDVIDASVQFTGDPLFENVTFKISPGDKIALVGANGTGKSTLLKVLAGKEELETGSVNQQKNIKIGYLPQEFISLSSAPLFDEVKSSLTHITNLEKKELIINNKLSNDNTTDEERDKLLTELGDLEHEKEKHDYYLVDSTIKKVLSGLGFGEKDFTRNTNEFSGGWQMRIELAKILLGNNDLILLDEPTNHLDIDSLEWLIGFLKGFEGALLIVSHDRHFINSVTNRTLEIFNNKIHFFKGNYDSYLKQKEERDKQLIANFNNMQKKIKETERFIERFRYKESKARQVQSRIKQLEKLELGDLPEQEQTIDIKFPPAPRSGVIPIKLENVAKSYGSNHVFDGVELQIERGDKIAFVGPNGAGKTTLAKIIAGKLAPTDGNVEIGYNTYISYYAQEVADNLDLDKDIIDAVAETGDDLNAMQIRTILGSFLFSDDDVFKKIKVLSGGEKSRVALARILLTRANLVVLDEPTNHLDFSSKSILQKALIDFNGSLIIVSHDVDFIRPICGKVLEVRNNNVIQYHGDIDYYLHKREEMSEHDVQSAKVVSSDNGLSKKEQKRLEAERRNQRYKATKELKRNIEKCEKLIEELEADKESLEAELADPKIFSNTELAKEKNSAYARTQKDLEAEYEKWTELHDKLEGIENEFGQ